MPRPDAGAQESNAETPTAESGVRRRRVLGGVAAGVAAPAVASAVPGNVFGRAAAAGRPPSEDWTSAPADSDINSVTTRGDVLIASTADGYVSVDESRGDRLWKYTTEQAGAGVQFHQGDTFVADGQTLVALGRESGQRWSNDYDQGLTFSTQGDTGYVASGSTLEAVSLADGSTQWSVTVDGLDEVERATENRVITTEGGPNSAIVAAHDPADGSQVWRNELSETVYRTTKSFGIDYVYFGYGDTLDAISVSDGSVAWSRTFDGGAPLVFGFRSQPLLVEEGRVAGLSNADGSAVWSLSGFDGTPFPVAFPETGLILATRNAVTAITLDGTRRWSYDIEDSQSFTAATAVGNLVYLVDGGTLYEVDAGEETWSYEGDSDALKTVASDDQRLYTNDVSRLFAFEHGTAGGGGGGETTSAPGDDGTTTSGGDGTTASGGDGTTASGGDGTTAAGGDGTTASGGSTDSPSGGTTATMGDGDAGTTASSGDGGDDSDGGGDDGGGGGSPGFGVLTALAAALLAAVRLLGGDDED